MKFFKYSLIVLVVLISISYTQQKDLDDLLDTNLQVQAAKKAYEAAESKIKLSGSLPDPMIETFFGTDPVETRNGPIENQIMVGQKFPLWGKLRKERNIQKLNAEIGRLNYFNSKIQVSYLFRKYLADLNKHNAILGILNEYLEELDTFISITRTQYANGHGKTLHPVLKLQIEKNKILSQINNTESLIVETTNNLMTLFDDKITIDQLEENIVDIGIFSGDEWIRIAEAHNPQLLMTQFHVAIAEEKHLLNKLQKFPDLTAGLTYSVIGPTDLGGAVSSGQDAVGFKIGFNIPLWINKNTARERSANYKIEQQKAILEDTWNKINSDLNTILTNIDENAESTDLYKDGIVSDAEQMVRSAYAAYEVGDLDYLDLLDSIRLSYNSKIEFEKLKATRKILNANLLKTAGLVSLN